MLLFCFPSMFRAGKGDCRKTRAGEDLERLREEQTKTPTWAGPGASRDGECSARFREDAKKLAENYRKFGATRARVARARKTREEHMTNYIAQAPGVLPPAAPRDAGGLGALDWGRATAGLCPRRAAGRD